jgi:hypothetical protein
MPEYRLQQEAVNVTAPDEPQLSIERERSWIQDETAKSARAAYERLYTATSLQQERLGPVTEALRRQAGQIEVEESKRASRERLAALDREVEDQRLAQRIGAMVRKDPRSRVTARLASCSYAYPPYSADWYSWDCVGDVHHHLDRSIGQFGGLTWVDVAGGCWLGTGVGEWFYSGANSGTAIVYADLSVYGSAEENAYFSYMRNAVNAHVLTWDAGGQEYQGTQTVHDNYEILGSNVRSFNGDAFSPFVYVPIDPYRYYFVWAWAEQYSVAGGAAWGGTHLWIYSNRIVMCV